MATPIFRYPLDPTGINPDNLVVREPHTLNSKSNLNDVRVFSPLYGPFFAESLVILDAVTTLPLVKDRDYKITDLLQDPTLDFGKEIAQFVVITDGSISTEIEVSYQVLGGNYQNDTTAVQHVFETFLNDTRPVDWSNIGNKPATYPSSLHIHLLQDIVNFGPLVVAINSLRDAKLLNNTPQFEALIKWITNRKTIWADIINTPTTLGGYGITDAVTLNTEQTVNGKKTFSSIHIGAGGTAVSADNYEVSVIGTHGEIVRAEARLVPKTRRIDTGAGLVGGGDLNQNLTLSLGTSGVAAGTYGNGAIVPVVTFDVHGRAVYAGQAGIDFAWWRITGKPTTADGYGITDVVKTSGDQYINGSKTFAKAVTAWGSTAANIDNGAQSMIVSDDYMKRYVAAALAANSGSGDQMYVMRHGRFTTVYGALYFPTQTIINGGQAIATLPVSFTASGSNINPKYIYTEWDEGTSNVSLVALSVGWDGAGRANGAGNVLYLHIMGGPQTSYIVRAGEYLVFSITGVGA